MPERKSYSEVFTDVVEWSYRNRLNGNSIKVKKGERGLDKAFLKDSCDRIQETYPFINSAFNVIGSRVSFVHDDNPVESFPQSPFAILHVNLQKLARGLVEETLLRAQLMENLPHQIAECLPGAEKELLAMEPPKEPVLAPQTILNLRDFTDIDPSLTYIFNNTFPDWFRALAACMGAKLRYTHSTIQGYNRLGVPLIDRGILLLDAISNCTEPQMRNDKREYVARIKRFCAGFVAYPIEPDVLTQPGKMFSMEMNDQLEVEGWYQRLLLGIEPEPML